MVPEYTVDVVPKGDLGSLFEFMRMHGFSHPKQRPWTMGELRDVVRLSSATLYKISKGETVRQSSVLAIEAVFLAELSADDPLRIRWRNALLNAAKAGVTASKSGNAPSQADQPEISRQALAVLNYENRRSNEPAPTREHRLAQLEGTIGLILDALSADEPDTVKAAKQALEYHDFASLKSILRSLTQTSNKPARQRLAFEALGHVEEDLTNLAEAHRCFKQASELYATNENLERAGTIAWLLGSYEEAAEFEIAALELAVAENRSAADVGRCHNNLGVTYAAMGRYRDAIKQYELASDLRHPGQGGDSLAFAKTQNNLAAALAKSGQSKRAIGPWKTAEAIRQDRLQSSKTVDDIAQAKLELSNSQVVLGWIKEGIGETEAAEIAHRSALEMRESVQDQEWLRSQSMFEISRIIALYNTSPPKRLQEAKRLTDAAIDICADHVGNLDMEFARRTVLRCFIDFRINGFDPANAAAAKAAAAKVSLWVGAAHTDALECGRLANQIAPDLP